MSKILIIAIVICLIASIAYERWAVNDALRKLHEIRQSGDEDGFLRAVDNPYIRMHISKFARTFMKLNYWVEQDREEEVWKLIPEITSMKCGPNERTALYWKLLGYARKKGWNSQIRQYIFALQNELKDKTDRQSAELRRELRYLEQRYPAKEADTKKGGNTETF